MTALDVFRKELMVQINRAANQGRPHIEVNAGELHRAVGGYDVAETRRILVCCRAMRDVKREDDEVIYEPPAGDNVALTIRYKLPR